MGKELQEQQKASTLECEECGAVVKLIKNRKNNHSDIPCPATMQTTQEYTIPEYCKHARK